MSRFTISMVTPHTVARIFHDAPGNNIRKHLPAVLMGLEEFGLTDRPMVLMALATIRAESAGFEPISEFRSKYNTAPGGKPFALYDIRPDLGNNAPGDGVKFRGRGFVQLTGRFNYQKIGKQIGVDLDATPDMANDSQTAGRILARFLKNAETRIRKALDMDDLKTARKLVNGGSHGLDRFTTAYRMGEGIFPA